MLQSRRIQWLEQDNRTRYEVFWKSLQTVSQEQQNNNLVKYRNEAGSDIVNHIQLVNWIKAIYSSCVESGGSNNSYFSLNIILWIYILK